MDAGTSRPSIPAATCFLPDLSRAELVAAVERRLALLDAARAGMQFGVDELPSPGSGSGRSG